MRSAVAAMAVVFALSACHRTRLVATGDRAAVRNAFEQMRIAFNAGDCHSIYTNAGAWFRANERQPDWERECDVLHKKLGSWQSTDLNDRTFEEAEGAAYVETAAHFDAGPRAIYVGWVSSSGSANLFLFTIQEAGAWVSFPSNPGSMNRYRDAPMDLPVRPIAMPQFPQR